ncbi:hypothetical protein [Desulfocastanea catecholica]
MTIKKYTIGGKVYTQRIMVLGQIRQLTEAIGGVEIPAGARLGNIAGILGDRLPHCAAAVLQPEGVEHQDKDVAAMAKEFTEHLDIATAGRVIDDFFVLTPATTLAEMIGRLGGVLRMIAAGTKATATGSNSSSSSSPVETSPSGPTSSGATD